MCIQTIHLGTVGLAAYRLKPIYEGLMGGKVSIITGCLLRSKLPCNTKTCH